MEAILKARLAILKKLLDIRPLKSTEDINGF